MPVALFRRLGHPHYIFNALICLPLPVILSTSFSSLYFQQKQHSQPGQQSVKNDYLLYSLPLLLFALLLAPMARKSDSIESLLTKQFWSLQTFNLVGFLLLQRITGVNRWIGGLGYLAVWVLISLVFPQPAYLGPSAVVEIRSSEEFDAEILQLQTHSITELVSEPTEPSSSSSSTARSEPEASQPKHRKPASPSDSSKPITKYSLVLFHADWSRQSREAEIAFARLSDEYSPHVPHRLCFYLVSPSEELDRTFYDYEIQTSPSFSSTGDLESTPVIMMFRDGKLVGRLPRGEEEVKEALRKQREQNGEGDESEDEVEVRQEVHRVRWQWDKSRASIRKAFRLDELVRKAPVARGSKEVSKAK
ncbi:hypothetical protein T439DRAFT_352462 [Meredithblackwellia eburnea MCA 4105]